MGIVSNAGGKGSAARPLSIDRGTFEANFDAIFGKKNKKPDPVKDCDVYKTHGCAHVDGPLCAEKTCDDYKVMVEKLKKK